MSFDDSALKVSWTGDLQANKDLFASVQKANRVLGEELGRSKPFVTVDWHLRRDQQDRPVIELKLTDRFTDRAVIEKFAPEEFLDDVHLENRIHRMWGALLH